MKFHNTEAGAIKTIKITKKAKKMLILGKNGVVITNKTFESFKVTIGTITALAFDTNGNNAVFGYSSGTIKIFSLPLNRFTECIKTEAKIQKIQITSANNCIITTKKYIFMYDLSLNFIKKINCKYEIVEVSVFHNLILLLCFEENQKIILLIDSISNKEFSFPILQDSTHVQLFKHFLIIGSKNSLVFYNFSTGNKTSYDFDCLTDVFIAKQYLIVVEENNQISKFYLENMNLQTFSIKEKIIDLKHADFDNFFVVCTNKDIVVYDEDFSLVCVQPVVDSGKIFVFPNIIYIWGKDVVLKLGFCDLTSPETYSTATILELSN